MSFYFDFDWDPSKAATNVAKHGIRFDEAATVFQDPLALNMVDEDHSETELRWVAIGRSTAGRLLVVIHTYTEGDGHARVRLISARLATPAERWQYEAGNPWTNQ